jgi:hypothetical protein
VTRGVVAAAMVAPVCARLIWGDSGGSGSPEKELYGGAARTVGNDGEEPKGRLPVQLAGSTTSSEARWRSLGWRLARRTAVGSWRRRGAWWRMERCWVSVPFMAGGVLCGGRRGSVSVRSGTHGRPRRRWCCVSSVTASWEAELERESRKR